jgi:hypothetical protein
LGLAIWTSNVGILTPKGTQGKALEKKWIPPIKKAKEKNGGDKE